METLNLQELSSPMSQPAVSPSRPLDLSTPAKLAEAVLEGDRRALARAITLVESTRPDHRPQADALLERLLPHSGKSVRLGITGVPGVGKSTFIESFGLHVINQGHRVAVLAVDPSSPRSGGSILGDKTRMEELSRDVRGFIRPSPSGCTLGGVARRTREAMLICEAAGFDVIIVETVGVGQSETAVAHMVDLFLLLLVPGGGDELQGIKKGIVELADAIVVTKSDGDLVDAAKRAQRDYANALHLLRPASAHWSPPVLRCSSVSGEGLPAVWEMIGDYRAALDPAGEITSRRAEQARAWMWSEISESLLERLKADPNVRAELPLLEERVVKGEISPTSAAARALTIFLA